MLQNGKAKQVKTISTKKDFFIAMMISIYSKLNVICSIIAK